MLKKEHKNHGVRQRIFNLEMRDLQTFLFSQRPKLCGFSVDLPLLTTNDFKGENQETFGAITINLTEESWVKERTVSPMF